MDADHFSLCAGFSDAGSQCAVGSSLASVGETAQAEVSGNRLDARTGHARGPAAYTARLHLRDFVVAELARLRPQLRGDVRVVDRQIE